MDAANTLEPTKYPTVGQAADRAHDAVERVSKKVAPAVERAASAAHVTIDRAAVAASDAATWTQDAGRRLAGRSQAMGDACSTFVRAQPMMTVIGAVAIGYLLGRVFR